LRDLSTFMISPKNRNAVAISQLHCHQEGDSLYRVVAPVYIIPHEKIVGIRGITADTKQLGEIVLYDGLGKEIRKRRY
jgi:hypothetical protein